MKIFFAHFGASSFERCELLAVTIWRRDSIRRSWEFGLLSATMLVAFIPGCEQVCRVVGTICTGAEIQKKSELIYMSQRFEVGNKTRSNERAISDGSEKWSL